MCDTSTQQSEWHNNGWVLTSTEFNAYALDIDPIATDVIATLLQEELQKQLAATQKRLYHKCELVGYRAGSKLLLLETNIRPQLWWLTMLARPAQSYGIGIGWKSKYGPH